MARLGRRQPKRAFITRAGVEIGGVTSTNGVPLSLVVGQQPLLNQVPFVFVERPPAVSAAAPDTPVLAVVPKAIPLPAELLPFVFVERPPSTPPAAPIETPARPLVVKALEAPPSLPEVFTAAIRAAADAPVEPVLVRAVELPWTPPQVFIAQTRITPPAPSTDAPTRATVVTAIQLPPATWRLAGTAQAIGAQSPPATDAPPKPIVVAAQQPAQPQPFIYVSQTETPPPAAAPQVPIPSTVVSAQPVPPQGGIARISKGFATAIPPADPQVPPRVTVVGPLESPQPVDQVVLYTVVSDWLPPKPTVVGAGPVPQALPFTEVINGRVDPAAPPPAVPIRPTIVSSQPAPPEYGRSVIDRGFAVAIPGAPPEVPIRPTVVNAQPLPTQYVQSPWVSYTEVDPPTVPVYPTVVGQQPYPPQAAFVSIPKGGRWGNPPPNHRSITPSVTTDMSLPFRPNGWVRVAHGFAEALPLLYEGTIVGGTLEGALVSGGVMTGSAIGGTIQNGYITGGVR